MTEQAVNNYDDEISLLDILVTLAESWKLLVFGPLIASVLAGALSFLLPITFQSTAIVRLTEAEVALVGVAPVLDPLIAKFDLLSEVNGSQDDARVQLASKITGKFDKKTGLSTITVTAATPERAQAMAVAAVDALLHELLPKGKNKDQIEQTISSNESIIANNADAVEQLGRQIGKQGQNETSLEVVMKHYAALTAEITRKKLENIELRKSLTIKGSEVFVQQPSLSLRKTSPKRSMVVLLTLVASGFVLVVFVLIRQSWRRTSADLRTIEKVRKIKDAFALTSLNKF